MVFTARHKIRFDDIDAAGFVYYPRLFDLCHRTFEDLFDHEGPGRYSDFIVGRRLGFPTVAASAEFSVPITYGDSVTVDLSVTKVGETSVSCTYEMRRERDAAVCCVAQVTVAYTDLVARKSLALTAELRELFERHRRS